MNRFALAIVIAIATLLPCAASAGELDLTGDLSGFSSPDNVYGPWRTLTASYRWQASLKDTPSVSLVTRADLDRLGPTHSDGLVVDDYHDFSPSTFGYAAVGLSAGNVLPTRNFYAEGDKKFGHDLTAVFGAGFGVVVNPNGVIQRYVNFGPSYYGSGWNVTLRYLQTFTTGRTATGTGIVTFQAGQTGKTIATLTLLAGDQPPSSIASFGTAALLGQRAELAGINVKHWIGTKGGVLAGVDLEELHDRMTGEPIYARRGITIGIFRNIGPALP